MIDPGIKGEAGLGSEPLQGFEPSPQQERSWSLQQEAVRPVYGAACAIAIQGELDAGLLRAAVERVVERHEILRTTLDLQPMLRRPLQRIHEAGLLWEGPHDLSDREPRSREALVTAVLEEPLSHAADGPPLRLSLFRSAGDRHVLVCRLPAGCADATSLGLLVGEIARSYGECARGLPPPEPPVQYADVAEWLRRVVELEEVGLGRRYWQQLDLSGVSAQGGRLWGRGPVPGDGFSPCRVDLEIGRELRAREEQGSAVEAFLLAVWAVLLGRLTASRDLVLGAACDGRGDEELVAAIGPYDRYLPLRVRLADDLRFRDVVAQVERTLADNRQWQDCFLWPRAGADGSFYFPCVFDCEARRAVHAVEGLVFGLEDRRSILDRFEVRLSCRLAESGWRAELSYDAGVVSPREAERLAARFRSLLRSAAAAPDSRVGDLEALSEWERHLVLREGNDTARPLADGRSVAGRFTAQARRTPAAMAVVCGGDTLSYADLDRRTDLLARRLRQLGVGPDVCVGLFLPRSVEMVVGLLAVLKAGGAYLPLDPGHPPARTSALLESSGARLVLTVGGHEPRLPEGARVLLLDSEPGEAEEAGEAWASPGPESLAYVLYTSGSTGEPKGVMISQRALLNYLDWSAGAYWTGATAWAPVHSPLGFDLTITSLLLPLVSGHGVVLVPEGESLSGLPAVLRGAGGSALLKITPAHLQALGELVSAAEAGTVGTLVVGGEALTGEALRTWRRHVPALPVVNEYGPTEAVVGCCVFRVPAGDPAAGPVPIGRPIANVRLYVVTPRMRLASPGAAGELLVGGTGLARGYLGRPELTAGRFVPDPFGGEPGERLYRTGDLVQLRPDGQLEFLGRVDHQVKVRGFRIEPGEIEAALRRHPQVRDGVVVAREDAGERRLVGYVVLEPPAQAGAEELLAFLRESLPEYMVPSSLVRMAALPLTPNGKVDRGALPAPPVAAAEMGAVPARTQTEELLAGLWSELLLADSIGPGSNFFALGGHSLLVAQLITRVRSLFGAEISMRDVFGAPTLAEMADLIDEALQSSRSLDQAPLAPVPRDRDLPISLAQQRLWFIDQLAPGNPAYNIAQGVRLTGRLRPEVAERALREIVRRHEILRTTFRASNGLPVQVISAPAAVRLPVIDLRQLPEAVREREMRRLGGEEARRSFDLERGPLFRVTLLRSGEREHVALLTLHHIVTDGWSQELLVRELAALYEAFSTGRPSPLPELPAQYADFAWWQRRWLEGEALERQLAYWRTRLDPPVVLDLPTDRPRPSVQTFRGSTWRLRLPEGLLAELKALGRRSHTTLFMVLLAAAQALCHRHSGQRDIRIGTPSANRGHLELESLIGLFVNTLVLRSEIPPGLTVGGLLARVREAVLEGFLRQDVPFEQLVEALQPDRDMSHNPLFQVMFVLDNPFFPPTRLSEVELSGVPVEHGTAKFDLIFFLAESPAGFWASIEYNVDLFDRSTVARMGAHLQRLLAGFAAGEDREIADLPLLGDAERHQVLHEWNDTAAPAPAATSLQELFERQARLAPQALAVAFQDERLTYAEVDDLAGRLAARLRRLGVRRGDLVALHTERCAEMVPALLGILRAGAGYVPLDPIFPRERLRWILASLGTRVVVTRSTRLAALDEALEGTAVEHRVCLDRPADWGSDAAAPRAAGGADDVAYVIFTSGSTGTPKGVQVRHRPVLNLIDWVNRTFGMGPADRVAFVTSLSFDLSVYDVFGLLAAGGTVHVVSDDELRDPERLIRLLYGEPVTFWDSAPAALQQIVPLLPAGGAPRPSRLRLVFLSGDWVPLALPGRVRESFPAAEVVALGGATEAAVWSNFHRVGGIDLSWASIPYGRPIRNARYHVLDERLEPCPVGVAGDLYIGGGCLASGYAGEPALTADKFLPDPFAAEGGARLYRTGDRARYRRDGEMEFLGRVDHQVKIRGFRIELGEIESALGEAPGVREAAVLAREDRPGDRQLVAYVVPRPGPAPAAAGLAAFLAPRLPAYMLPSAFVMLESLPVTANGKLDRAALPAPDAGRSGREVVPPRTAAEAGVVEVWSGLLGGGTVSIHDRFFDLGGHSLLATQAVSRLREVFRVDLPLRALFELPTAAEIAAEIERLARSGRDFAAPPLAPVSRGGFLPASFAQERLWFLEQLAPGTPAFHMPLAVRLAGALDVPALAAALQEVVRRHEALRTILEPAAAGLRQVIAPGCALPLPEVDLGALPAPRREAEAARLGRAAAGRPFDLARAPLARAVLLRLDAGDHALVLTLHHLVSDGWSLGVLTAELAALYEAFRSGRPSPLPELEVQYADFARWQRDWLQGEALAGSLAVWRRRLGDGPEVLELPADRPRPAARSTRGSRLRFTLPPALAADLAGLGRRRGTTLFMTLLAGLQALLGRYTGQDDVAVGTPSANRGRPEVEPLIGCFINSLVLRTDLGGGPGFGELLDRVREVAVEALALQELPFEKLLDELQPERSLTHTPLFQVMFSYQVLPKNARRDLPGLRFQTWELGAPAAAFDLDLTLEPAGAAIAGDLVYGADLFDATTVARLAGHFETLLAAAAADPDRRIAGLPLMSEGERHQLLVEWDATGSEPADRGLHELFAGQAARTPEAVAVTFEGGRLTYGELAGLAAGTAAALRRAGAERNVPVAVLIAPGPAPVAGMLAALQAGCPFVCLDPAMPAERLREIVAEAGPRLALCAAERLEEGRRLPVSLQLVPVAAGPAAEGSPRVAVDPGDPAYIVYTSGSTGRPKGIVQSHRAFAQFLAWQSRCFGIVPPARVVSWATLTYDAAYCEVLGALCFGATLCMAREPVRHDPAALLAWLQDERATLLQVVPSFFRQLLDALDAAGPEPLPDLETVLLAGEALPADLVRRWRARFGERPRLVNLYGPSEAVLATWCALDAEIAARPSIPLGAAIDGRQMLVLDGDGRPCPLGVPGELYIRSRYLTSGYLARPQETAASFLQNPLHDLFPDPVYRTGDRGRWRPDGRLEFLGRRDGQVKIRGIRVELREVEEALRLHPAVADCAAAVHDLGEGELRLAAYLVERPAAEEAAPAGAALAAELRELLRRRLPEAMVPATFTSLPALPRTRTGKLDRKALPKPDGDVPPVVSGRAPASDVELRVAAVWSELLRRPVSGVDESFFNLGGHSLLATRVVNRLRQELGVEVALRDLFEEPTVAGLAKRLEAASAAVPAPPAPRHAGTAPASFAQERLWYVHQLEPDSPVYNLSAAVRLRGALDVAALERSFAGIVRRHESLRTRFVAEDGLPVQVIAPQLLLPLVQVDLSRLPAAAAEEEARTLAGHEVRRPFDLSRLPLLRVLLLRVRETEHVLTLVVHHIVGDGWSMGVLVREVAALYGAFAAGLPSPLPELPLQYADLARQQRERWRGEALETQLGYWRRRLAGAPPLALPADRPRAAAASLRGARLPVAVPAEVARRLREIGERERATPFMVLLAAYKVLLARYARQDDVVVGIDVSNRERAETEGLIGFLVNQLAIRSDLGGNPTFRELLGRVRQGLVEAYAHQELPFQSLVAALQPRRERDPMTNPLFQVMFSLDPPREPAAPLPGLALESLPAESGTARFELTLRLSESGAGLAGEIEYRTDLFDARTVAQMARRFEALLAAVAAAPDTRLDLLQRTPSTEKKEERSMEPKTMPKAGPDRFKKVQVKAVSLPENGLVAMETLTPDQPLPLVVRPAFDDVDLADWAASHRELIEEKLLRHGALLFRGFQIDNPDKFERFASTLCPVLFNENGEHPRQTVSGKVYTPVFYPPEEKLLWHNENSFNHNWPTKIFFCCVTPPPQGGETPIVDSRRVYERLDPEIRERFEKRGVMYLRNYGDGLGLHWHTVFGTTDRGRVEEHCAKNLLELDWKEGDRLRTRSIRPAVIRHPKTGEVSWFNQGQHWHVSCLQPAARESLRALFAEEDLPRNLYYGDGTPIEDSVMAKILEVYQSLEVSFPWQRGDVMLLDNVLTAHGRNPFAGERKLLVSMGEMRTYQDVEHP